VKRVRQMIYERFWTQIVLLRKLARFGRRTPRQNLAVIRHIFPYTDLYWRLHRAGNDRTTYVIGLFGSGRWYLVELLMKNLGPRAKYIRDTIRLHRRPTSMVYCSHATIRHVSRFQALPRVTSRILEAVRARSADLIFIYRHPLDSLLTNWVWWRAYLRNKSMGTVISIVYKDPGNLCADLEKNFAEFESFAKGDPAFYATSPGPRFLSFPELVEETELFLSAATLALRFEDFMIDPAKELSKTMKAMSIDHDENRLQAAPPSTRPYRYLAVAECAPRFRGFIDKLDAATKKRIETIGYRIG
jgi:hypothetical protein